jgi:tetratricopeptide (TPR) repeat protein
VLVGHLVAALPLAFLVARCLRAAASVNEAARGLWIVIGFALAGIAAVVCPGIGESIASSEFGVNALLVLRTALALGIVLPWCVWALDPPAQLHAPSQPRVWFSVCLGIAIVPCGLYAEAAITARTATANEYIATGRLAKTEHVLIGLVELGSDRPVAGKPPAELQRLVRQDLDRLTKNASYPLSPVAPHESRFSRCVTLIQLDRLDEAAELVQPFAAEENPTAVLLLATIDRDRERWAASDVGYERALTHLLPKATTDASARGSSRLAFDGLAYNARMDHRPADAERAFQRGLESLPGEAAYFHFQLGQHYANTGRPALAIEHLTKAAELDPAKHRDSANHIIQNLRTSTPMCVLPR